MEEKVYSFIIDLAVEIRSAVAARGNSADMKAADDIAFSGDTTFAIDKVAEQSLIDVAQNSGKKLAFFSEDKGLVKLDPDPELLLIVDPIDGTRPLLCGLKTSVVSIALCPYSEVATFGNIIAAAVVDIDSADWFYAESGKGLDSNRTDLGPSATSEIEEMFWNFDTIGRPVRRVVHYLHRLIDASGMKGAPFLINSACFSLTKVITGELDAYVDVGGRILNDEPESESEFLKIGNGSVMGTFPYDLAAAYLLVKEAGCAITDAYGRPLDDRFLIRRGKKAVMSCIAASNNKLHREILNTLNGENSN